MSQQQGQTITSGITGMTGGKVMYFSTPLLQGWILCKYLRLIHMSTQCSFNSNMTYILVTVNVSFQMAGLEIFGDMNFTYFVGEFKI